MKWDKNDTLAFTGTILFHLAVLLLLLFAVLKTVVPEDDGGVLVNFGNINASAGVFEPRGRTAPIEKEPIPEVIPEPVKTKPTPQEDMITQDTEETITLTNKKKEEERKKREETERKEKERLEAERKRKEEQRRREQAIQNQVAGAFGSGNADSESQGDAPSGTGNQGNPFGNSDSGASDGTGGMGSFNLNGRSIGSGGLPRPAYTVQEEGRIVINITVDSKGNVIMAEVGKGTTIDNGAMRSSALDAAKRAKFNSIQGANNQSGTITYTYKLR
ncbi:MAG: energy transducer TonB [Tannerella sp.]|jgi:TonB family protein|nr:energy transducer TonB [Tannerella sp.]